MSFLFNGSANSKLTGALGTTYDTQTGCTMACKVKFTIHPLNIRALFCIGSSAVSNAQSIRLATNTPPDEWMGQAANTSSVFAAATVTLNSDDAYASLVMVCTNDSARDMYINSSATTAASAVTRDMGNLLQQIIVGQSFLGTQNASCRIAELAFWNVPLATTEVDDYCNGVPSSLIQAANLPLYIPMDTNTLANIGTDTAGDLTAGSAAVFDSDHPIMISSNAATGRMLLIGVG